MTNNQTEETKESVDAAVTTFGDRVASIIDDPFKSALAATASCAIAITFVISGIGLVSVAIG